MKMPGSAGGLMRAAAAGAIRRVLAPRAAMRAEPAATSSHATPADGQGLTALIAGQGGCVCLVGTRVCRPAGLRALHAAAGGDGASGGEHRAPPAWKLACGAGLLAALAAWQSQEGVRAEAEAAAPPPSPVRPSLFEVRKALAAPDAATLEPALAALAVLADDDAGLDDAAALIAVVGGKEILGHADGAVRAAAVCALSALVASDDKAAAASLPALVQGGAVAACQHVLADAGSAANTLARAAALLAHLSAYDGGWLRSAARKSSGYADAVAALAQV